MAAEVAHWSPARGYNESENIPWVGYGHRTSSVNNLDPQSQKPSSSPAIIFSDSRVKVPHETWHPSHSIIFATGYASLSISKLIANAKAKKDGEVARQARPEKAKLVTKIAHILSGQNVVDTSRPGVQRTKATLAPKVPRQAPPGPPISSTRAKPGKIISETAPVDKESSKDPIDQFLNTILSTDPESDAGDAEKKGGVYGLRIREKTSEIRNLDAVKIMLSKPMNMRQPVIQAIMPIVKKEDPVADKKKIIMFQRKLSKEETRQALLESQQRRAAKLKRREEARQFAELLELQSLQRKERERALRLARESPKPLSLQGTVITEEMQKVQEYQQLYAQHARSMARQSYASYKGFYKAFELANHATSAAIGDLIRFHVGKLERQTVVDEDDYHYKEERFWLELRKTQTRVYREIRTAAHRCRRLTKFIRYQADFLSPIRRQAYATRLALIWRHEESWERLDYIASDIGDFFLKKYPELDHRRRSARVTALMIGHMPRTSWSTEQMDVLWTRLDTKENQEPKLLWIIAKIGIILMHQRSILNPSFAELYDYLPLSIFLQTNSYSELAVHKILGPFAEFTYHAHSLRDETSIIRSEEHNKAFGQRSQHVLDVLNSLNIVFGQNLETDIAAFEDWLLQKSQDPTLKIYMEPFAPMLRKWARSFLRLGRFDKRRALLSYVEYKRAAPKTKQVKLSKSARQAKPATVSPSRSRMSKPTRATCLKCGQEDHETLECPTKQIASDKYCAICGEVGHTPFERQCAFKAVAKFQSSTVPSAAPSTKVTDTWHQSPVQNDAGIFPQAPPSQPNLPPAKSSVVTRSGHYSSLLSLPFMQKAPPTKSSNLSESQSNSAASWQTFSPKSGAFAPKVSRVMKTKPEQEPVVTSDVSSGGWGTLSTRRKVEMDTHTKLQGENLTQVAADPVLKVNELKEVQQGEDKRQTAADEDEQLEHTLAEKPRRPTIKQIETVLAFWQAKLAAGAKSIKHQNAIRLRIEHWQAKLAAETHALAVMNHMEAQKEEDDRPAAEDAEELEKMLMHKPQRMTTKNIKNEIAFWQSAPEGVNNNPGITERGLVYYQSRLAARENRREAAAAPKPQILRTSRRSGLQERRRIQAELETAGRQSSTIRVVPVNNSRLIREVYWLPTELSKLNDEETMQQDQSESGPMDAGVSSESSAFRKRMQEKQRQLEEMDAELNNLNAEVARKTQLENEREQERAIDEQIRQRREIAEQLRKNLAPAGNDGSGVAIRFQNAGRDVRLLSPNRTRGRRSRSYNTWTTVNVGRRNSSGISIFPSHNLRAAHPAPNFELTLSPIPKENTVDQPVAPPTSVSQHTASTESRGSMNRVATSLDRGNQQQQETPDYKDHEAHKERHQQDMSSPQQDAVDGPVSWGSTDQDHQRNQSFTPSDSKKQGAQDSPDDASSAPDADHDGNHQEVSQGRKNDGDDSDSSSGTVSYSESDDEDSNSDKASPSDDEGSGDESELESEPLETDEDGEKHIPLTYQIPREVLRRVMKTSSSNKNGSSWTYLLYQGPNNEKIKLHYCRNMEVAEKVAKYFVDEKMLGFDIEWKPNASAAVGIKGNTSLIQLASEDRIALFHISLFKGKTIEELLPATLKQILEDPTILKSGVAVKSDFTRLKKYLGVEAQGVFELSHLYKLVKFSKNEPVKVNKMLVSLANQVAEHLQLPLHKGAVRESDWSKPLDRDQMHYAASDAYAGVRLYDVLEAKRKKLKPTPPRPHCAELNLPIELAPGVTLPAKVKPSKVKPVLDEEDAMSPDEFESALEDQAEEEEIIESDEGASSPDLSEDELTSEEESSEDGFDPPPPPTNRVGRVRVDGLGRAVPMRPQIPQEATRMTTDEEEREPRLFMGEDIDSSSESSEESISSAAHQIGRLRLSTTSPIPTSEPSASDSQPSKSSASTIRSQTSEIELAEFWINAYKSSLAPSYKIRATHSHLRAYALWYEQGLELKDVAKHLRIPPLALSTVSNYVLSAVVLEDLPYEVERIKAPLYLVPHEARLGRFNALMKRLIASGAMGV